MQCPNCGTFMNRHAEKALQTASAEETQLLEVLYCPGCGKVEAQLKPRSEN